MICENWCEVKCRVAATIITSENFRGLDSHLTDRPTMTVRVITRDGEFTFEMSRFLLWWFDVFADMYRIHHADMPDEGDDVADDTVFDVRRLPISTSTMKRLDTLSRYLDVGDRSAAWHGDSGIREYFMTALDRVFRSPKALQEVQSLLPTTAFCAHVCRLLMHHDLIHFESRVDNDSPGAFLTIDDGALEFVMGSHGFLEMYLMRPNADRTRVVHTFVCVITRQSARALRQHWIRMLNILNVTIQGLRQLAGRLRDDFETMIAPVIRALHTCVVYGAMEYHGCPTDACLSGPDGMRVLGPADFRTPDLATRVDDAAAVKHGNTFIFPSFVHEYGYLGFSLVMGNACDVLKMHESRAESGGRMSFDGVDCAARALSDEDLAVVRTIADSEMSFSDRGFVLAHLSEYLR